MTITPRSISLQVPAKLNPQLRVGPLREDGYHDITLVYQAISIYDTLHISHNPAGPTITVTGTESERIPTDGRNLVLRAARALAHHVGFEPHVHFDLIKAIPTQAGLGGGSADAAAALVGCNMLLELNVCDDDLMALGANLGEDVPFFIKGMMALGLGHKKPIVSLQTSNYTWNWVLGVPAAGLSTKSVFERFDHILARSPSAGKVYLENRQNCIEVPWGTHHPQHLISQLVNDLEGPSTELLPDIEIALHAGKAAGAVASLMSGSGSTCAFLARDETHARSLMMELQRETVFKDVLMASGPVEGARVLQEMS
ncbi:Ribosomal protein S5 domain 2-type fold subgroup [Penicillium concentricum]|uniref:4-(cytidine 5'-diphospho)-2-C-methyl-D-erythritol kinase n=1 Tax=Penicillium concentricum TaxID=293559 RepID=A0A9W9SSI9_9EURO|nr:Ribosomal protein S5 domain 2-type fold subgroup [Penicillium concentricum]KAJ5383812.1 Ribosomal protein S5 domain 2-type fold subgroup [Penicillium concentricum]